MRTVMSRGIALARVGLLAGIAMLPVLAQDQAQTRSCWLRDLASPVPSTIYALCEQGSVWISADGGATWSSKETGAKAPLRAMAFLDTNHGLAVGDDGLIMATTDGGKTWNDAKSGTAKKLMDIAFVGNDGWVAGYNGLILHSSDGGRSWTAQDSGTTQTIESVFFLDEQHRWRANLENPTQPDQGVADLGCFRQSKPGLDYSRRRLFGFRRRRRNLEGSQEQRPLFPEQARSSERHHVGAGPIQPAAPDGFGTGVETDRKPGVGQDRDYGRSRAGAGATDTGTALKKHTGRNVF